MRDWSFCDRLEARNRERELREEVNINYDSGYNAGYREGYKMGYQEGLKAGYENGVIDGKHSKDDSK